MKLSLFRYFKKTEHIQALEETAVMHAIQDVVRRGTHYAHAGHPYVRKLEEKLSKYLNAPALGVNSGTDALILSLKALGIGPGDEVIVPAFSYISTASSVSWINATPVFADVCPDDFAIDPAEIEKNISDKTKAVIVAHLFGQPSSKMKSILEVANRNGLYVIEDAAQAFGSMIELDGEWRHTGTMGDLGCLSFSSTKPFAAPGNGGAVIVNHENSELYDVLNQIRFYGAKNHYFDYPAIGVSAKLHEIHAAALLAKMQFREYWLGRRAEVARWYREELSDIEEITLPEEKHGTRRIWYRYVIRAEESDGIFDYLQRMSNTWRLRPSKNYPVPLPYFSAFKTLGYRRGSFEVADKLASQVISLPLYNSTTREEVKTISAWIRKAIISSHA